MRYALPLVLLLLGSFLPLSGTAQAEIIVDAPVIVAPGEEITIRAELVGNVSNVTITYNACTDTLCGYPTMSSMVLNGTVYEAVLPSQENGYYITYQITALVDGVQESTEEMRLDISSLEEVSSLDLELYAGIAISGAIVFGTLAFVLLSKKKRGGEDETREYEAE